MPLDIQFSAANRPVTAAPTGQDAWDYLFGWISPGATNKLGLPVLKQRTLQRATDAIISSIEAILIPAIQANLVTNKSVFTTALHDSFSTRVREQGTVSLISSAPYALTVEFGSGPRNIDNNEFQNIVEWAEFKFPKQNPQEVANNVTNAIQAKGNIEHPYIKPAIEGTEDILLKHVTNSFT